MDSGWSLPNVAIATSAIFLFHGLVLVPLAEKALRRAEAGRVGFWAAVVTTVSTSKLVWMALALSALLTWCALLIAGHLGADTAAAAAGAIQRLRGLRTLIVTLEGGGSLLLLGLATAALLYWIWRYRVRRAAGVLQQVQDAQIEALFEKLKEGTLPDLEPTTQMLQADAFHQWLRGRIEAIEAELAGATGDAVKDRLSKERDELIDKAQLALSFYVRTDLERRVQITPLDAMEGDIPRPPRTIMEHIGRFFISRGLLGRLTWAQRALLVVNLLLAIPTALVAAQADIGDRLDRRTLQLAELSVDWTARDESARLAADIKAADAATKRDADKPTDETTDQAANRIAHVFETRVGRAYGRALHETTIAAPLPDEEVLKARRDMRAQKARHDILALKATDHPEAEIFVDPDPVRSGGTETRSSAAKRIPGVEDWSTQTASSLAREEGRPVSNTGRLMARRLREKAGASPAFRDALVKAAAGFKEVAKPSQVSEILIGEIFSGVAHAGPLDGMPSEMREWIAKSVSDSAGVRVNSALSNKFVATLFETHDVGMAAAALDDVARTSLATADFSLHRPTIEASLPTDPELADIARSRHPGFRQAVDSKVAGNQYAAAKAVYLRRYDLHGLTPEQVDAGMKSVLARAGAIQGYDDLVPPSVGPAAAAEEPLRPWSGHPPGGVPPSGSPGGGGGGGFGGGGGGSARGEHAGGRAPIRASSPAAVARGRSFVSLRGFSRVGGVVIGRDPESGGPSLDIRGFDWRRDGGLLRFQIKTGDGSTIEAGPYHASVVHGALAYAADGRALTATMISAEPLERVLKILLHPALLDTTLGCRAVSIDRFADEATGADSYPDRRRAELVFQADVWLYEIARAAAVDVISSRLSEKLASELKQSADHARSLLAGLRSSSGDDRFVADLIGTAAKRNGPSDRQRSVLRREDHFSAAVTRLVETCQGPDVGATQFATCVADRAKSRFGLAFSSEGDLVSAVQPVPEFQIWSGVREAPFAADAGLAFVVRPNREALQFMVQAAFKTPPYQKALAGGGKLDEAAEQTDPYEFDGLKITDKVRDMVASSREKQDVFDGVAEFTALQRFFRLALHGGLGANFPVEKLTALEAETRADVKAQTTPRWNAGPLEWSFLSEVARALPTMPANLKAAGEACLKSNGLPVQADAAALQTLHDTWSVGTPISSREWAATCVFVQDAGSPSGTTAPEDLAALVKFSRSYPEIRDLRHSLGIDIEERRKVDACGPM